MSTYRMNEKRLVNDLTDLLARALHYQEKGEPDYTRMTDAEISALWAPPVPEVIRQRYMNEAKFHMQVQRAVAGVMTLVTKAQLGADQLGCRNE
jgi:hypothetical protein